MIPRLIGLVTGLGVPSQFAKPLLAVVGSLLLLGVLWGSKCAYDRHVISAHEAKQDAANAKADRKADQKAAEQRRADDSRLQTETQEIKDAVQKAGSDPAARRAAYYKCVQLQQRARASGQQPANC